MYNVQLVDKYYTYVIILCFFGASDVIYFQELLEVRTLFLCKHIIYLYSLS